MHSVDSRLYRWAFQKCFAESLECPPQTILGVTMVNNVHHRLSCCYLEGMDFRAPMCKWTKLAMEGRIETPFWWSCFNVGVSTVPLQCLHVVPFIIHSDLRHARRTLKNLDIIQEMHCSTSLFFGDRYRVRNLLTLVIYDVVWIHSTIHPLLPSFPINCLFNVRPSLFGRPGATVSIFSTNLVVLLPYCSIIFYV